MKVPGCTWSFNEHCCRLTNARGWKSQLPSRTWVGVSRLCSAHAGWREYSDIPISYGDIEEVRPAPALPAEVQAQWERAQWVLYLLRRRVHLLHGPCKQRACKHVGTHADGQRRAPGQLLDMRMMAGAAGHLPGRQCALAATVKLTEECFIEHTQRCCSLGCPAGRT
jgi:hypothetical protein